MSLCIKLKFPFVCEAKEDASKKKVERPEWMLVPPEVDYLRHGKSNWLQDLEHIALKRNKKSGLVEIAYI